MKVTKKPPSSRPKGGSQGQTAMEEDQKTPKPPDKWQSTQNCYEKKTRNPLPQKTGEPPSRQKGGSQGRTVMKEDKKPFLSRQKSGSQGRNVMKEDQKPPSSRLKGSS